MHFLINELSFVGQAKDNNIADADRLMNKIVNIIKEIEKIKGSDPIQTHSNLSSRQLSQNLTLYQWVYQKLNSSNRGDRTLAMFLIQIIIKVPFIDVQGLFNNCQCFYNDNDVSNSSVLGAVHLKGILISLQNAKEFSEEYITVNLKNKNQDVTIHNLTQISQAKKICPRYQPHPKHYQKASWKDATPMDLNDEEAQIALDKSIEFNRQRFSYYNDRFYRFHFDNAYNAKGYPTYHGYPIESSTVPDEIRSQLID